MKMNYTEAKRDIDLILMEFSMRGIEIENLKEDKTNRFVYEIKLYLSVPSKSHIKDDDGNELAGDYLLKWAKEKIYEITGEKLKHLAPFIKFRIFGKIRNEEWSREKEENNNLKTLQILSSLSMMYNNTINDFSKNIEKPDDVD